MSRLPIQTGSWIFYVCIVCFICIYSRCDTLINYYYLLTYISTRWQHCQTLIKNRLKSWLFSQWYLLSDVRSLSKYMYFIYWKKSIFQINAESFIDKFKIFLRYGNIKFQQNASDNIRIYLSFHPIRKAPRWSYMAQNLHHFPPLSICYLLYGIGNSW